MTSSSWKSFPRLPSSQTDVGRDKAITKKHPNGCFFVASIVKEFIFVTHLIFSPLFLEFTEKHVIFASKNYQFRVKSNV